NKKQVQLYSVTGLDFQPQYIWLDEAHEFFAAGGRWLTVIREGWDGTQETLLAAQERVAAARNAELSQKLAHRYAPGIVFQHANIFDADTAKIVPDQTVVIAGNRITKVGASNSEDSHAGALVIDATGKTLIPGL